MDHCCCCSEKKNHITVSDEGSNKYISEEEEGAAVKNFQSLSKKPLLKIRQNEMDGNISDSSEAIEDENVNED